MKLKLIVNDNDVPYVNSLRTVEKLDNIRYTSYTSLTYGFKSKKEIKEFLKTIKIDYTFIIK